MGMYIDTSLPLSGTMHTGALIEYLTQAVGTAEMDNPKFADRVLDLCSRVEVVLRGPEHDHNMMVKELAKPSADLARESNARKLDLNHMALGIAGEAGEIVDAIKKHTIYNQLLDVPHLCEELGDLEFFLSHLRELAGLSRSEILEANVKKLRARYGDRFTNEAAKERADKL